MKKPSKFPFLREPFTSGTLSNSLKMEPFKKTLSIHLAVYMLYFFSFLTIVTEKLCSIYLSGFWLIVLLSICLASMIYYLRLVVLSNHLSFNRELAWIIGISSIFIIAAVLHLQFLSKKNPTH
jgi:hypothetical protein